MLELQGIEGGYGGTTVLRDVSLSIPSGSVVALLGPNGAGKSTTMRMASGLLRPRSGRVLLNGKDVTAVSPSRRASLGICHIMEGRSIFPSLSVRENLLLQAPRGAHKSEIMDRTSQEFPQLTKRGKQLAGTLSGGEQQMLALMRAYLAQPRLVLVDEASLGLAPVIVDQIFAFLERISGEGVSLLIVEQYANRALAIASAVYLLSQGRIVYSGPAGELDEDQIFALYAQHSTPAGDE
ncbi:MAG TPA: ABC transporter ATP-binding protein [Solirubrobacteraceae bacterium]|jgi:branched-chain amino acid transport system ATP-binding protein